MIAARFRPWHPAGAPILRAYATRFCDVDISLVCEPSSSLLPRIDRGELDLALVTRHTASRAVPDQGVFLFEEHLVWAASEQHEAWRRDPLPLALHELGSNLRTEVLSAVSAMGREYRVVYGSPNMRGQIATTESGLAVAVMSRCCVPPSLKILDSRQGMPALPKMEVAFVRSKDSARSLAVDMLYKEALHALQQER
ncbi:LysR substrate-binding domain-containing protein [Pseudomonas monteilii]|uniref:LysR substrate-binding domain-containing protein n=1 Tax=Pseudomonas monteilii TaxID=76759 RepID=UPI003822A152